MQRNDGAYRWIVDLGVPRFSPGGAFLGYLGFCFDIHERKLAQRTLSETNDALQRQNDELKAFVYGASHDLKEPLRTISIYTELLAKRCSTPDSSEAEQFFRFVIAGVQRMQTLIRDLSEYSYVVHCAQQKLTEVDCNAALEQARFVCQAAIQQTHAILTQDPLPTVRADQPRLVQVLQNLISNALKYSRTAEPPRVHVSATLGAQEWLFRVTDNGIGFDPRYAERIFGLFQRLHSTEEYSGTGLGLAICRKIVERHNGRIWAESEPGRGSSFFFTLPAHSC